MGRGRDPMQREGTGRRGRRLQSSRGAGPREQARGARRGGCGGPGTTAGAGGARWESAGSLGPPGGARAAALSCLPVRRILMLEPFLRVPGFDISRQRPAGLGSSAAAPQPGPAPPPPQGYGHGLGAGVRAGTPSERRRRLDGVHGLEPQDRALGCAAARSRPWPAQPGAAALAAGRPPPSLLPPPPPELRAPVTVPARPCATPRLRACARPSSTALRRPRSSWARTRRSGELQGSSSRRGTLETDIPHAEQFLATVSERTGLLVQRFRESNYSSNVGLFKAPDGSQKVA